MPTPAELAILRGLVTEQSTLTEAGRLLDAAKVKTRPGSGHQVKCDNRGLAAICALLASEREQTNDVSETAAQTTACLSLRDFRTAKRIVVAAVRGLSPSTRSGVKNIFGDVADHAALDSAAVTWMERVYKTVADIDVEGVEDSIPNSITAQAAVVFWVCKCLKNRAITAAYLIKRYGVERSSLMSALQQLDSVCSAIRAEIEALTEPDRSGPSALDASARKLRVSLRITKRKGNIGIEEHGSPAKKTKARSTSKEAESSLLNQQGALMPAKRMPEDNVTNKSSLHTQKQYGTASRRSQVYSKSGSLTPSRREGLKPATPDTVDVVVAQELQSSATSIASFSTTHSSYTHCLEYDDGYITGAEIFSAPASSPGRQNWLSSDAENMSTSDLEEAATGNFDYGIDGHRLTNTSCSGNSSRHAGKQEIQPCRHVRNALSDRLWWDARDEDQEREEALCEQHFKAFADRWGIPESLQRFF